MKLKTMRSGLVLGAWLLSMLAALPARADVMFYTDAGAFAANATGLTTITFEGIAPANDFVDVSSGLTLSGVTFNSTLLYVVDPAYNPGFYDWGSGAVLSGQTPLGGPATITVTLPSGISAIGSDIMTFLPDGDPVTITLDSGATFTAPTLPNPDRAFVGVTSTSDIASLTFSADTYLNLDNVRFGSRAVPEPSSIVLAVVGGAIVFGRRLSRLRPRRRGLA